MGRPEGKGWEALLNLNADRGTDKVFRQRRASACLSAWWEVGKGGECGLWSHSPPRLCREGAAGTQLRPGQVKTLGRGKCAGRGWSPTPSLWGPQA